MIMLIVMVMMIKMIMMNILICNHALQPDPCNILSSSQDDVEDDHDDHDYHDDDDYNDDHAHLQPCPAAPCNILSSPITAIIT